MSIQWYPGHMLKARRQIQERLNAVDLVMEIIDARIPASSRNPDFDDLFARKTRILVVNKADLADPAHTKAWLCAFVRMGAFAVESTATSSSAKKKILDFIRKSTQAEAERLLATKHIRKTFRALVVGIPNVGKSSLINTLAGSASARTADVPGLTRGTQVIRITPYLELMDTPGVLWPKLENQAYARHLAYVGSIGENAASPYEVCIHFLKEASERFPSILSDRYGLEALPEVPEAALEAVCRRRGWIVKGGEADLERGAAMILQDYRAGKLGRVTWETPEGETSGIADF